MDENKQGVPLADLIGRERANISVVFQKWWDGELNDVYRASFYHSKMLLKEYEARRVEDMRHTAGEKYCEYIKVFDFKGGELFSHNSDVR